MPELAKRLGKSQRTLKRWQKKGVAGFKLVGRKVYGDPEIIAAAAENMGAGRMGRPKKGAPPRPAQVVPALTVQASAPGPRNDSELGSLLDLDKLKSIVEAEQSGDIGDDIAACRRVRHRLQGIVEAWKPERLAEAPDQRQFLAFASELTKTIGRLGQLEGTLIATEKKHGRLLTIDAASELVTEIVSEVVSALECFRQSALDEIHEELLRQERAEGIDFDVLGDVLEEQVGALRRSVADVLETGDQESCAA